MEGKSGANLSDLVRKRPLAWMVRSIPFHVDPLRCRQVLRNTVTGVLELCDVRQVFRMRLKAVGVMHMDEVEAYEEGDAAIDWILRTNERTLKYVMTKDAGKKEKKEEKEAEEEEEEKKAGHMIPRIRTGAGALIAILHGMVAGKEAKKNGLVKGQGKAVQFFRCLEFAVISKM